MVGAKVGTAIAIANIILAGVVGIFAGGITCAILRRPWGLKTAGLDAGLAIIVAVITGFVLAEVSMSRGVWLPTVEPAWAVAGVSVIVRNVLRRSSR